MLTKVIALASLSATAYGHGYLVTPKSRVAINADVCRHLPVKSV